MALGANNISNLRSSGVIMHVNKVSHVTTIDRVAADLGESEDWLFEVAGEMDTEDGVIWIRGAWRRCRDGVHRLRNRDSDRTDQNPQRRSDAPGRLETPDCRCPRPTPDGYGKSTTERRGEVEKGVRSCT